MVSIENGPRVDPEDVRRRWQLGENVVLVCAYDDEAKCRESEIEGALTLRQLDGLSADIAPSTPLVFYCA